MTTSIPAVVPPLRPASSRKRHYPPSMALSWLAAGWRDLVTDPVPSLFYGVGVFIVSAAIVAGLFAFGLDYILFPAFAGFMVVGPILAVGLYEKSRRLAAGQPVGLVGSTGDASGPHLHLQLQPATAWPQQEPWFQSFAGRAFSWSDGDTQPVSRALAFVAAPQAASGPVFAVVSAADEATPVVYFSRSGS